MGSAGGRRSLYNRAMTPAGNPLLDDRLVHFVLYELLDAERLCQLPAFAEHNRDTFDMVLQSIRRLAREHFLPTYRPMDEAPPVLRDGAVIVHPQLRALYDQMVELGVIDGTRPESVGGQQLPALVMGLATAYLMAGNLSAYGYAGLTTGAAHLIEAFGSDELKERFMGKMYAGEWTGTMALTEPQAGSSLSDITTSATPTDDGHYLISGNKIFISGGDHDLRDNIVHLLLARIDGAPAGTKGISLFAVPKRRPQDGQMVDNDVHVAGLIHKIGWRALPSLVMSYGEAGDCRGWLVGEPHRGLSYMFQMMNEARLMVGLNGIATASVAYHEALAYARTRPQGRTVTDRDPSKPQVAIIEHADVRRMLLRQKAIVEGSLALYATAAMCVDELVGYRDAIDDESVARRTDAQHLLDLLTPIVKSFPAERGFEANALAVQIHGGYGYSSEYLPESWLRDQKLNTIHEGTTGIQSLDLLGRRVVASGGAPLRVLAARITATITRAQSAEVSAAWCAQLEAARDRFIALTQKLGMLGMSGQVDVMLRHSVDYLDLMSIVAIAWQWLDMSAAAKEAMKAGANEADASFYEGKLCAAQYWFATELPRIEHLASLCESGEDSYARMRADWF